MIEPQWTGKRGIITGSSSGIGAATAAHLTRLGAHVVGVARGDQDRTSDSCRSGFFSAVSGDVSDADTRRKAIELAAPEGKLDFLVNNAAVFLLAGKDATRAQWMRTLEVNLVSVAEWTADAAPFLAAGSAGAVVNISSISAHVAQASRWTYNSAKGGLNELTRCQALDLAPVRVNSVSPGWIWTEVLDEAAGGDREKWEKVWGAYAPLLRCGEPEEIAFAIEFLLSDRASFITGTDLAVDGGYLAAGPEGPSVLALDRG
ncbi:MAG: SDR family oxidoreductase [Microcella sp.]|uniref:SDR family oxidoreductase n=1 Tax=Microcella sp. TaxID=1913979 RepID=UPI00331493AA